MCVSVFGGLCGKCGTGRQTHTLELRTRSPSSQSGCWIATLVSMAIVCVCVCVWVHETKFRSFPPLYVRKKALVVFYSHLINTV